jgi:mannosyl-oligosaccharide alpha-1,2-mannosidase
MFRYRRYRVFVVFAVVTVFALYQFGSTSSWRQAALLPSTEKPAAPAEVVPEGHGDVPHLSWEPRPHEVVKETKKLVGELSDLVTSLSQPLETPPPIASVSHPAQKPPPGTPKQLPKTKGEKLAPYTEKPVGTGTPVGIGHLENDPKPTSPGGGVLHEHPEGKLEVAPLPTETEVIHWQPRSEHFPVPSKSIIQLPSGKPAPIPKIQFEFKEETPEAKADRLSKLKVIKTEFMRSWNGYKEKAWMKDEVMPVSGEFKNGFNGWGATLVDSLDTLWMMGLKTEFEEAVEAVKKIDFTTTPRADIPLFETTIRYLGGLVAAYDISDKKYSILLGKAVELAEILMGAFDTPNRMPITYYYWRP